MITVGDEISGWCPRCKLNQYMNVAATDGREVFTTTCRTCHNTNKYAPERSKEQLKEEAWKKLNRMRKRKQINPRGRPEVVTKPRRGESVEAAAAAKSEKKGASKSKTKSAATDSQPADDTARWREKTKHLGFRDGKPYKVEKVYKEGDVMLHKRHGMGIVEAVLHDNACLVLFRTGQQPIEMGQGEE